MQDLCPVWSDICRLAGYQNSKGQVVAGQDTGSNVANCGQEAWLRLSTRRGEEQIYHLHYRKKNTHHPFD